MIQINNKVVDISHFPDGTFLLKEKITDTAGNRNEGIEIKWNYENNEELLAVYFLTRHIQAAGFCNIVLNMPYIPNARQDRVKNEEDVFTLKYFAEMINSLAFREVRVLDAHSNVSLALIDRVKQYTPRKYIEKVICEIEKNTGKKPLMFYPDEGAGKRYSSMITLPYCFGIKKRDWSTGEIKGLSVAGEIGLVEGSDVLMVDDICSYGGTFIRSAEALAALGAENICLFVSHCEDSVLRGKLCECSRIKQIYTTDSIFREKRNTKIRVFELENE
ncbi:MAG: ribose-phosphate pyrophosphokinase [Lachnospiraceae bacterium]|nr:ribose-phosphate pyrophosphokinase [Lachnospiraceae bacterium]